MENQTDFAQGQQQGQNGREQQVFEQQAQQGQQGQQQGRGRGALVALAVCGLLVGIAHFGRWHQCHWRRLLLQGHPKGRQY